MHLKNLFSNDFSISEMSAIFPVNGKGCEWDTIRKAKEAHPKDICFTEGIDNKTKLNFSVELPLPKTLYILLLTTKKRKKGMYLLFFVLFTHYAKLCAKLPYLRTKLPIR